MSHSADVHHHRKLRVNQRGVGDSRDGSGDGSSNDYRRHHHHHNNNNNNNNNSAVRPLPPGSASSYTAAAVRAGITPTSAQHRKEDHHVDTDDAAGGVSSSSSSVKVPVRFLKHSVLAEDVVVDRAASLLQRAPSVQLWDAADLVQFIQCFADGAALGQTKMGLLQTACRAGGIDGGRLLLAIGLDDFRYLGLHELRDRVLVARSLRRVLERHCECTALSASLKRQWCFPERERLDGQQKGGVTIQTRGDGGGDGGDGGFVGIRRRQNSDDEFHPSYEDRSGGSDEDGGGGGAVAHAGRDGTPPPAPPLGAFPAAICC